MGTGTASAPGITGAKYCVLRAVQVTTSLLPLHSPDLLEAVKKLLSALSSHPLVFDTDTSDHRSEFRISILSPMPQQKLQNATNVIPGLLRPGSSPSLMTHHRVHDSKVQEKCWRPKCTSEVHILLEFGRQTVTDDAGSRRPLSIYRRERRQTWHLSKREGGGRTPVCNLMCSKKHSRASGYRYRQSLCTFPLLVVPRERLLVEIAPVRIACHKQPNCGGRSR